MEAKLKHLEFIQATINRMAGNSFLLKGWAITIAGGLLALSFKEMDRRYVLIGLIVIILFWLLDGYYLSRERNFVKLYENVSARKEQDIDFSMNISSFQRWWHWPKAIFSKTILIFYGAFLAILLLLINYI